MLNIECSQIDLFVKDIAIIPVMMWRGIAFFYQIFLCLHLIPFYSESLRNNQTATYFPA